MHRKALGYQPGSYRGSDQDQPTLGEINRAAMDGLSVRGNLKATRLGTMRAQPQRAKVSEKLANLLIVTVTGCLDSNVSVIEALQNRQTRALSGFSLPHFGQFICISLIY